MIRIRAKTVKPVLGTLLTFMGMKRANARVIEQANKQVILASLCYNLKKYLTFTRPKVKCLAISLTKELNWIEVLRLNRYELI